MYKRINNVYFIMNGGMGHYMAKLAKAVSKRVSLTIIGQKGITLDYINSNIKIKNVLKYPIGFDARNLFSFRNIVIVNKISIFIETLARIIMPSGGGKFIFPISDLFLVQWKPLLKKYGNKAKYWGRVI